MPPKRKEPSRATFGIGERIEAWFRRESAWYAGEVVDTRSQLGDPDQLRVRFDDGQVSWLGSHVVVRRATRELPPTEVHCVSEWQQLETRCRISRGPLTDPARGTHCKHPPCCNFAALRTCVRAGACPVQGCQAPFRRLGDVVRAVSLREALEAAPEQQHVWLRGDPMRACELQLEAPPSSSSASSSPRVNCFNPGLALWKTAEPVVAPHKRARTTLSRSESAGVEVIDVELDLGHLGTVDDDNAPGQAENDAEGAMPTLQKGLPPGWHRRTDFGKQRGYRGPAGERVQSRKKAWEMHLSPAAADPEEEVVVKQEPGVEDVVETETPQQPLVTEAEGMQLHLSKTKSGYTGVCRMPWGRFSVTAAGHYLGMFGTAVEAAVAYARAVASRSQPSVEDGAASDEEVVEIDDSEDEVDEVDDDNGDDEPDETSSKSAGLREKAGAWCDKWGFGGWMELSRLIREPPYNVSGWKNQKHVGKPTMQRVEEKMQAFFANDDGANLDDVDEVEVEVDWAAQPHEPNPAETMDSLQQQLEDVRRQLAEEKRRHAADVSRLNQQVQLSADGLRRKQRALDLEREERRKERAAWEEGRRAARDKLRECRQELEQFGRRDATQLVVLDGEDEEDEVGSTSHSEEHVESVVDEAEGLQLRRSSKNASGYACVRFKAGRPKPYFVDIYVDGQRKCPHFATAVEAAVCLARHVGEHSESSEKNKCL